MPQTKNAMVRYKILDRLLSDRNHDYSLDDLTEAVSDELAELYPDSDGVTRRTVEKDIHFIEFENTPQAEIRRYSKDCYDRKRGKSVKKRCMKYADPGFTIFNQDMSDEERELLAGALNLLGHFEGLPQFKQLEALRWKVGVRKRKHKVISLSKGPSAESNILGQLFNNIVNRQVIQITYRKFKETEDIEFIVSPYILKEFNRRWYLVCKDCDSDIVRNLALDRIICTTPLPAYKYEKPKEDVSKRYDDIIGITYITDNPLMDIIFWVSDESDDYVHTKPIHHSQRPLSDNETAALRRQQPSLQGGTFFTVRCRKNYELIRELTSYGKELLVISPQSLKEEIIQRTNGMQQAYSKMQN